MNNNFISDGVSLIKTLEEKLVQEVPEILALQTMKQTLCKIKNPENLINTGF